MESKKGKNNFLKKHGLCAVWLMERLSGWRRQQLGRLTAGRVIARFLSSAALRAFVRLCTRAGRKPFLPLQDCHKGLPAASSHGTLSLQTPISNFTVSSHKQIFTGYLLDSRHQGIVSRDVKRASWSYQPIQLVLGCPSPSPDQQFRSYPRPNREEQTESLATGRQKHTSQRGGGLIRKNAIKVGSDQSPFYTGFFHPWGHL